ncbi:uncharacterized protein LOC129601378 [Paramacrobiotus metropolitanus]|uniref:uncharacterized protein LOC129601378 n=1 Tax=Paramacrobiotus metropolitanus TaxID=2943436 RepID=UPI002445AEBB|nr:uncharacterized protein LOC129601378 [Paramacrobiotus metropolitanus]
MCWLLEKVPCAASGMEFGRFLDEVQYSRKGILKYEAIFGDGFVSTGGQRTTSEFCQMVGLQRGQYVLDVGAGIAGSAFHMAKEYGVHVTGVDLSSNMFSIAVERRGEAVLSAGSVDLEIADILTREYAAESFDLIYSRDVILHIADKRRLFQQMFKWLKPGGKLLVTDYCCGDKAHSTDFQTYVQQRGYILLTVAQYGQLLEEVGFVHVKADDRTQQFISVLHNELRKFEPLEAEFVEQFSREDYEQIVSGWNAKVGRCHAGDQAWGLFIAEKDA